MKITRKFIIIALCTLLLVAFSSTAYAEEAEFSGILSKTVKASENGDVEVLIDIAGNPGIIALNLEISYDSNVLSLKENGFVDTELLKGKIDTTITLNPFRLGWQDGGYSSANNFANGTIAKLYFTMSDGFYGTTDIEVKVVSAQKYVNNVIARPPKIHDAVISVTREMPKAFMNVNGIDYMEHGKGWAEAVKLANSGTDATIILLDDWLAESGAFTATNSDGVSYGTKNGALYLNSGNITIDLNGFTISRGLTSPVSNGQVFVIEDEAQLTVLDNSADSTGTITGGNNDGDGGAFYIDGATLTVIGGKIVGNKAENGGGIYMEKGYLYIDGGEISGNEAENGGGIYWDSKNVFCLTAGTITGNKADDGAGVYATERGDIYVGGTIVVSDNTDSSGNGNLNFLLEDDDTGLNNAAGQNGVPNKPLTEGAYVGIYSNDINFCISESDSMFDANSVKYLHTDVDTHVIRPVYNKDGGNHAYMLYYNDSNSLDVVFPYINSVSTKSYYVDEAILNHDSKTVNLKVNIEIKDSGALEEVSLSSLINTTFGHEGTEIVDFNENRDMTKPQEFMVVGTDGTYTLFTVEVEWVIRDVKILEYSLLLGGSIGVKVYVNLSHNAVLNLDDVKTTVDFMGITYDAVLENANNPDHETLYFAKFYVAAKEMHEDITFTIDALNTVESVTVSVKNYVDYINANSAEYADSIDLINAMYNYGEYSRKYFLGADITPNPDLAQTELTLSSDYTPTRVGSAQGIRIYSSSLLLESNTTIRHYFKLDDGASIDDYTFTLDGESLVPTLKNGYYYVDITNIVAYKLGEMRTVEVSCGDETLKVIYSPLSYVKLVTDDAENQKDNLLTLVKALYNYYIESNEYAEYIGRS